MMNKKNLAKGLLVLGAISVGFGVFMYVRYAKLKAAYQTTVDDSQAISIVEKAAQGLSDEIEPDEFTRAANVEKGTNASSELTDLQEFEMQSGLGDY